MGGFGGGRRRPPTSRDTLPNHEQERERRNDTAATEWAKERAVLLVSEQGVGWCPRLAFGGWWGAGAGATTLILQGAVAAATAQNGASFRTREGILGMLGPG